MKKIILKVDGMSCGMCEAHVNDAVRKAAAVKKVTSSHSKGITEIIANGDVDVDDFKAFFLDHGVAAAHDDGGIAVVVTGVVGWEMMADVT